MTRSRSVFVAFLLALSVFLITHAAKFPGSLAYLMEVTQGQKILDMQASFSADETYQRLEAFGELGRQMYLRTMLTVDVVFPVTVFLFLYLWGKYASDEFKLRTSFRRCLLGLSVAYFALDLFENASIVAMLLQFPERLEILGTYVGYLTRGKRIAMMGAFLIPAGLLIFAKVSKRLMPAAKRG